MPIAAAALLAACAGPNEPIYDAAKQPRDWEIAAAKATPTPAASVVPASTTPPGTPAPSPSVRPQVAPTRSPSASPAAPKPAASVSQLAGTCLSIRTEFDAALKRLDVDLAAFPTDVDPENHAYFKGRIADTLVRYKAALAKAGCDAQVP